MARDVFICHSSKDKTVAHELCVHLEAAGIDCCIAPRNLQPGQDYSEQLVRAIEGCRLFLLVFSQHANESRNVLREVELASNSDKNILPVRIEDVVPADRLAFYIRCVHWFDGIGPLDERCDELIADVRRGLGTTTSDAGPKISAPSAGTIAVPGDFVRVTYVPVPGHDDEELIEFVDSQGDAIPAEALRRRRKLDDVTCEVVLPPTAQRGSKLRVRVTTWDHDGQRAAGLSPTFSVAASKREDEEERLRAASPHWVAAALLLRRTLFCRAPQVFADELIERILQHFRQSRIGLGDQLFRAARLFVESRIFRAARGDEPESLAGPTPRETFDVLVPALDCILASLEHPVAETFRTCFDLATIEDPGNTLTASCYFAALGAVERELGYTETLAREAHGDRWSSLTCITVRDGFIAPTYLVAGLLRQFEENWHLALNRFNRAVPADSPQFVRVQRFQFYCWLLWGPSIPACACERWSGSFVALQYGYGDENNSFPLLLEKRQYQEDWKRVALQLADQSAQSLPLALGAEFRGSLVWGPEMNRSRSDFPSIYVVRTDPDRRQHFEGEPDDPPRRSIFDGLMLRADAIEQLNAPRLYYSAYMWIMFELCTVDMRPRYTKNADRWKFLLPIFEHSNLADGETLAFLKRRLAEKAFRSVMELERGNPEIRLRYVCAVDDPGGVETDDGRHVLRFGLEQVASVRRGRLRELLARAVLTETGTLGADEALGEDGVQRVMRTVPAWSHLFSHPDDEAEMTTSCDLPTILDEFYRTFLGVGAAAEPKPMPVAS